MDCAICLTHIDRRQEAFLHPCGHYFCLGCIQLWSDRQRQHDAAVDCPPGHRCTYACPLCKTPYSYIVYDCIGTSCRLIPMCGQPKTMGALPLSADQSRRRALYVTPAQLAPARQVPVAKRARSPQDTQSTTFIQRELQAVLLSEDVALIVQHVVGVLQALANRRAQQATHSHSGGAPHSAMYGDKGAFIQQLSASLQGFLPTHSERFAEQLWDFLHCGLTVSAFDKLIFGSADDQQRSGGGGGGAGEGEEPPDQPGHGQAQLAGEDPGPDW